MAKNIIADSGFWYGLFNARDQYHGEACDIERLISNHNLVVPWPSLYETLNTRMMRKQGERERLRHYLQRSSTVLLEDTAYRKASLDYVLGQKSTKLSLVDHVIRSMLEDTNVSVHALVTFNQADFIDVCQARHIDIIEA